MDRFPKWVWAVAAAFVVVVAFLATCSVQRSASPPKAKEITSIYGERLHFVGDRIEPGNPPAYLVELPVSSTEPRATVASESDRFFTAYAGAHADELGFRRVVVRPVRTDDTRTEILGYRLGWRGRPARDDFIYTRSTGAVWTRLGATAAAPKHIEDFIVPSGARFALTTDVRSGQTAIFIYECLTCSGTDAAHHLAVNFYEMLKTGFLPRANPTSLAKVSVVVFLGRRHTVWEFPQQMHVTLQRGEGGQWLAPQLTPLKLQAILEAYAEGMQNEGRKLRGAAK